MKKYIKYKYIIPLLVFLGSLGYFGNVLASSTIFVNSTQTAIATSTVIYATPGTATTTLTYDSYLSGLSATNGTSLLFQVTASSTNTTYNINEEYSQDNIDWYQGTPTVVYGYATTTLPMNISQVPQYSYGFASSTPGLSNVLSNNNKDSRLIYIPTPTRFVRIIITLKTGGTNGAFWAQLIPTKNQPQ